MSLKEKMVSTLKKNENEKTYLDSNGDFDFGIVLNEFTTTDKTSKNVFRYPDGKEEVFSFDN